MNTYTGHSLFPAKDTLSVIVPSAAYNKLLPAHVVNITTAFVLLLSRLLILLHEVPVQAFISELLKFASVSRKRMFGDSAVENVEAQQFRMMCTLLIEAIRQQKYF